MKKNRAFSRVYSLLFLASIFLSSCNKKTETLFTLLPAEETGITFNNRIEENDTFNILTHEYIYNGGGVGIADFNNDGFQDIFFCGNLVPNKLYLNRGDLEFDDISADAGIQVNGRWNSGVAIADINNDGWMDIYVCATMHADSASRKNMLFINEGVNENGIPVFTDQAEEYNVDHGGYTVTAAFFDYDRDDDLDLYLLINQRMDHVPSNYRPKISDGSAPNNDRLFRNNNNGTFTDVTSDAGIILEGFGLGLCISDLNQDGWPDIYVSNDYLSNDILYVNNQDGTFTNRIAEFVGHQSQFSMGNDAADINNDALPDIITTDMLPETNDRKKSTIGNKTYLTYINNERYKYEHQYVRNMLHLNNGFSQEIKFSEIGQMAGIHQTEWSWSPLLADFDNDGHKDLIVTNGFPKDVTDKDFANYRSMVGNIASMGLLKDSIPVVEVPNYVFRNNGDLTFTDMTREWGFEKSSFSNGASFADLDNDGDLDYVVNNINSEASVYRNDLYDGSDARRPRKNNFLRLKLSGRAHQKSALGAKVKLFSSGGLQYYENTVYRGFLSSVENIVHFGLGFVESVDSVVVQWSDGNIQKVTNPEINRLVTVEYLPGVSKVFTSFSKVSPRPMLKHAVETTRIKFKHSEDDKIDFNVQRTLPHKFTQSGPGMAVGDVNGDALEDLVVGGSTGYLHSVFLQNQDGTFKLQRQNKKDEKKSEEDEALLLFDADGDGDNDLYIVSGSMEHFQTNDPYQDRLFINDGKGNFRIAADALPDTRASGSCVRASDFDRDGDLDLFVGGRLIPGQYPLSPESYLLRNDSGKFSNVTAEVCPEIQRGGMVSDALWTDFNGDSKVDLIAVGEFTSIMFYENTGTTLRKVDTGIDSHKGWWNSITSADYDRDGDVDYVVGNLGLNNSYQVAAEFPLKVYAKDFDANGSMDAIIGCYMRESMSSEEKKLFPVHFWDELNSQSPKFRNKFSRYRQYGKATMDDLLDAADMDGALVLEANQMASVFVENVGQNTFKVRTLPALAQVAPVNGMITTDVNEDGFADVVMVGNDYGNEVFAGRYDAFTGLILLGDGNGSFMTKTSAQTGFYVPGDAKALVRIHAASQDLLVASQNQDSLAVFVKTGPSESRQFVPGPLDVKAEWLLSDGQKQMVELYYGSGYLSQSSRTISIPSDAREVIVYNSTGESRKISAERLSRR